MSTANSRTTSVIFRIQFAIQSYDQNYSVAHKPPQDIPDAPHHIYPRTFTAPWLRRTPQLSRRGIFSDIIIKMEAAKEKLLPQQQKSPQAPQESHNKQGVRVFLRLLFAFERNYESLLLDIDPDNAGKDIEFVSRVPGYRKYQLVFLFYLRRAGLTRAFLLALLFPLPFTLLFYLLSSLIQTLQISNELEIVLIGLRCSVISYLCRYCLHFPEEKLNWIIYMGSIACAIISNNNYTFIIIYLLSMCLSYFKSEDVRNRSQIAREEDQFRAEKEVLKKLDTPMISHKRLYPLAMVVFFLVCWIAQRMYVHSHGHYYLVELFLISLLGTNQELSTFFPGLYSHMTHHVPTANIYALGYLLPGLHLKTFFLLFAGQDWQFLLLSYLAVHLPSLLLLCAALAHREVFFSLTWRKISDSLQAASNGLVLVGVGTMLWEENCQFNIAFFTSLVIFTVTKLYKFNEMISALLGVFLVASRAAVLHLNNKKSLADFLCRGK